MHNYNKNIIKYYCWPRYTYKGTTIPSKITYLFAVHLRDVFSEFCKPKTKLIPPANHNRRNNTLNQSELEVNTCNFRQAREKACEQRLVLILLILSWEIGASFRNQSQSVVKQSHSKCEFLSTLN